MQHLQLETMLISPTKHLTPRQPHTVHPFCKTGHFIPKQDCRRGLRERRDHFSHQGQRHQAAVGRMRSTLPLRRGLSSEVLSAGHQVELLRLFFLIVIFKGFLGLAACTRTPTSIWGAAAWTHCCFRRRFSSHTAKSPITPQKSYLLE